ncbi:cytochrome P450 [Peniophora sp. CONT]|nr:cytochrome P450 [Peniophora sp. CONT]
MANMLGSMGGLGGMMARRVFTPAHGGNANRALSDTPPSFSEVVHGLSWTFWIALIGYVCLIWLFFVVRGGNTLPGPSGTDEVKETSDAPERAGRVWHGWAKKYGPLFGYTFGSRTFVVANDLAIAKELLENRIAVYASRPRSVVYHEIISDALDSASGPPTKHWTKWRAIQDSVSHSSPQFAQEAAQMVKELLAGKDVEGAVERYVASCVSVAVYGTAARVRALDEPVWEAHKGALEGMREASKPGLRAVETWPFLQYLPPHLQSYLPPLRALRLDAEQTYLASLLSADPEGPAIQKAADVGLDEREKAWALAAPLREGVEPTAAWLRWCIAAALIFPNHLAPLLKELSALPHAPTPSSLPSLPHTRGFAAECLRYWPTRPVIARATLKEDTWVDRKKKRVYEVPKGAGVYVNVDAIVKDDASVESAKAFDPERKVDPTELGVFGFGARRCPGSKLAEEIVVLGFARILHATRLSLPPDGSPPPGNAFAWSGTARGPAAFEAVFESNYV